MSRDVDSNLEAEQLIGDRVEHPEPEAWELAKLRQQLAQSDLEAAERRLAVTLATAVKAAAKKPATVYPCNECGKRYRSAKAALNAMSRGCAKCGGTDIDFVGVAS